MRLESKHLRISGSPSPLRPAAPSTYVRRVSLSPLMQESGQHQGWALYPVSQPWRHQLTLACEADILSISNCALLTFMFARQESSALQPLFAHCLRLSTYYRNQLAISGTAVGGRRMPPIARVRHKRNRDPLVKT